MNYLEKMSEMTGYAPIGDIKEAYKMFEEYDTGERDFSVMIDTIKDCIAIYDNYELATELIMFINWKSWEHFEAGDEDLSQKYVEAFYEIQDFYYNYYEDNSTALTYYYKTTD